MKNTLEVGVEHRFSYRVGDSKLVPALYPEAEEFLQMPQVFATGFLVGLIEWTCIQAVNPHLDWPQEQTVGIGIDMNHLAATPPGFDVVSTVRLVAIEGKKLTFEFEAHDGIDTICRGTHVRFVINKGKFDQKLSEKMK